MLPFPFLTFYRAWSSYFLSALLTCLACSGSSLIWASSLDKSTLTSGRSLLSSPPDIPATQHLTSPPPRYLFSCATFNGSYLFNQGEEGASSLAPTLALVQGPLMQGPFSSTACQTEGKTVISFTPKHISGQALTITSRLQVTGAKRFTWLFDGGELWARHIMGWMTHDRLCLGVHAQWPLLCTPAQALWRGDWHFIALGFNQSQAKICLSSGAELRCAVGPKPPFPLPVEGALFAWGGGKHPTEPRRIYQGNGFQGQWGQLQLFAAYLSSARLKQIAFPISSLAPSLLPSVPPTKSPSWLPAHPNSSSEASSAFGSCYTSDIDLAFFYVFTGLLALINPIIFYLLIRECRHMHILKQNLALQEGASHLMRVATTSLIEPRSREQLEVSQGSSCELEMPPPASSDLNRALNSQEPPDPIALDGPPEDQSQSDGQKQTYSEPESSLSYSITPVR